jgi:microcystin-dependent protein
MSLETATTISGLVSSNPTPGDPVSQGDDHLRLIKSVLKIQFPGTAGQGYATPITATEAELNHVHGVTVDIMPYLMPVGAIIIWFGSTVPTGWKICDGTLGTPDLRGRFVMGVNTAGGFPDFMTGGTADSVVPAHTHTATSVSTPSLTTGSESVGHTHTFVTGVESATHTHQYNAITGSGGIGGGSPSGQGALNTATESAQHTHSGATNTESVSHIHGVNGTIATNTTIASTGVSAVNANLPPFMVLAYIMKT